jgi:hypothetical protein
MNAKSSRTGAHSADVRMELRLAGRVLSIAQLGPDFLILKSPTDHPPAEAEIAMSIDGHEDCWRVHLVDGIAASQRETRIRACDYPEGPALG